MPRRVWAIGGAAVSAALAAVAVLVAPAPPASAATFTAGLTAITGTSDDFGNQNGMSATQVVSGTTGGGLTKVSLYISAVNAAPLNHGQVAVYSDVNDSPGAKLVASGSQVLTAKAWNNFPLTGPTVAPSTKFWLVFNVDGGGTKYKLAGSGGRAAWKIPAVFGTWPDQFGAPTSGPNSERYAINMTWDNTVVPPTTTTAPPTTTPTTTSTTPPATSTTAAPPPTTTTTAPPSGPQACPPLPVYPTADCTGVPPGTTLTDLAPNLEGSAYQVTQDGTVLDGVHIPGTLVIKAHNVTVKNSLIDGMITNNVNEVYYGPFTVTDTTIGPASGCLNNQGITGDQYTATRVEVRNLATGFQAQGSGQLTVRDSFAKMCGLPPNVVPPDGSHASGFQGCLGVDCTNIVLDHNTFDDRNLYHTAPVTIGLGAGVVTGFSLTGNLLIGGVYTIYVEWHQGANFTIRDNAVVNNAWDYGAASAEGTCAHQTWSGNQLVNIDTNYAATPTGPLGCID